MAVFIQDRDNTHMLVLPNSVPYLDIATSAVNLLLVLHCELDHQGLPFIGELVKCSGGGVEFSVLSGLEP